MRKSPLRCDVSFFKRVLGIKHLQEYMRNNKLEKKTKKDRKKKQAIQFSLPYKFSTLVQKHRLTHICTQKEYFLLRLSIIYCMFPTDSDVTVNG